jgi:hypothetical protein
MHKYISKSIYIKVTFQKSIHSFGYEILKEERNSKIIPNMRLWLLPDSFCFASGLFVQSEVGGDNFLRKVVWFSTDYATLYQERQLLNIEQVDLIVEAFVGIGGQSLAFRENLSYLP